MQSVNTKAGKREGHMMVLLTRDEDPTGMEIIVTQNFKLIEITYPSLSGFLKC
jgi:hypothetical protein